MDHPDDILRYKQPAPQGRVLRFPAGRSKPDTERLESPDPVLLRYTEVKRALDHVTAMRAQTVELGRLREAVQGLAAQLTGAAA